MSGTGGFIALTAKTRGPFLEKVEIATGRTAVKIKLAVVLVERAPHPSPLLSAASSLLSLHKGFMWGHCSPEKLARLMQGDRKDLT